VLKAVQQQTQKNAATPYNMNANERNDQKSMDPFGKALTLQN
jgi:hypothetical protein